MAVMVEIKLNKLSMADIDFSYCKPSEVVLRMNERNVKFLMKEASEQGFGEYEEMLSVCEHNNANTELIDQSKIDFILENFIQGFDDDFFSIDQKPFSSNPKNKLFDKRWKATLKEYAPDIPLKVCELFIDENYFYQKFCEKKKEQFQIQQNTNGKSGNFVQKIFKSKKVK